MRLRLLLLPLVLLTLAGCEPKKSSPPKQVLRLNLTDDPASIDPRLVRSIKDLTVVKQLFDGLMRLDAHGVPQPAVAQSVDVSDDFLTYTFQLRETFWNNGDPVTAFDFEHAWKKVLEPSFASDYAYMLYPIKNAKACREGKCLSEEVGVTALDAHTLVVQLQIPTPYFLELVAFPTYYPVNQQYFNGPFYLKKWVPQTDLVLEKNPHYWDHEAVHLDQIAFSIIPDSNTESLLFEKNQLDWLGQPISHNIGTEFIAKLKEQGQLDSYNVAGTVWIQFNTEKAPFNNEKLRKAFSYAINRNAIITHILQGKQSIATSPLPPSMAQHAPLFDDGAISQAKQLFDEAIKEIGSLPKIVLNFPPTVRDTKIVQLLQDQWKEAFGIKIELVAVETQLYRRNVRQGLFQVATGAWFADYHDPLAFLELFKYRNDEATGFGMNDTRWHDETFTTLLEESLTESDPSKRSSLLQEAEKILITQMPIAPLYHCTFDYVKKPYVHNVILSPLGPADFKTTEIKMN